MKVDWLTYAALVVVVAALIVLLFWLLCGEAPPAVMCLQAYLS
jgi:hypothetical protein